MNTSLTVGTVVDTNDPQQMGRIRISVPAYHDTFETKISDIPWATYVTPFGGVMGYGTRGPDTPNAPSETNGPMSYGMWAIPKVGAQVIVSCIDGNPELRIWIGCIYTPALAHTLPHGRYMAHQRTPRCRPS